MVTIDTAMVLAAGLGTRIRALSGEKPKPLVEVAGKPLIDWSLDLLGAGGVTRAVVNIHYKADQIETHLASRTSPQITLSDERGLLLETGGGLMKATSALGRGPIFCTNTDAIFEDGSGDLIRQMQSHWRDDDMDALLLLVPAAKTSGYDGAGDFLMDTDGRLSQEGEGTRYVFTGLQIIHPRLWAGEAVVKQSTRVFWERARASGRFFGLLYGGRWMHVGDPAGHAAATSILTQKVV
ncbi:MAG: nucleotidyltransferase family protein [Pseudomonadota bacterium]